MKKCPTCDKTFEDSMKFCQVDGTPLVDDEPAFDPYATMVAPAGISLPAEEKPAEPAFEPQPEEPGAIAPPEDILDLPEADPLKTMYVSEAELKEVMGGSKPQAEEAAAPEPPTFIAPEVPPPSFGDVAPPPSPFSTPEAAVEESTSAPPPFEERETMIQAPAFDPPAPVAEWTPPPAPDAAWQNQEVGSNTPFQPPAVGVGGESKGLALGSLICGILSCTICCGMGLFLGPAAAIMGFIAKKKADEDPQQYGGRGMALAGMITGAVGLVFGVALIIMQVFFGILGNLPR